MLGCLDRKWTRLSWLGMLVVVSLASPFLGNRFLILTLWRGREAEAIMCLNVISCCEWKWVCVMRGGFG